VGSGQEFIAHMNLYDYPDPRRLDLRASLRSFDEKWLVRVNRQRAGINVWALVDVSASMAFGSNRSKLQVTADFVEALGLSAFRVGDAAGLMAFDVVERSDLFIPARVSRGMGTMMSRALLDRAGAGPTARDGIPPRPHARKSHVRERQVREGRPPERHAREWDAKQGYSLERQPEERRAEQRRMREGQLGDIGAGLEAVASRLVGQQGLVFLVSDFHCPLERLGTALDYLAHTTVVPIVVWDPAETEPPTRNALATLRDAESSARRTLWIRPKLRDEWRRSVAERRAEINTLLATRNLHPFYMEGAFDADALSRYFFEADA